MPASHHDPLTGEKRDGFALTRPEARAATRLLTAKSTRTIATELDLRESTVRQYTKSIRDKTETDSQIELVRLLSSCLFVTQPHG